MKYRKTAVIEAVEYTGVLSSVWYFTGVENIRRPGPEAPEIADGKPVTAEVYDKLHNVWVPVRDGDFIIQGSAGEYYPHDGDLFRQNYEAV